MKRMFKLALVLPLLFAPSESSAQRDEESISETTEELNLAIGENKTISAVDVANYSEGARGVADVKLTTDGKKFVIVGKAPGTTSLLLINKDNTQTKWVINVFSQSPEAVEREVKQLLQGNTGLRVRRVGARFFIEGGVTTESDVNRVERIASLYPGQVESLVVVGSAPVERKLNIRIDFFFVQYNRTSSYAFGLFYPSRIGGEVIRSNVSYDMLANTVTSAQASIVNHPLPGLDIAADRGWVKVLKQSTVITTNGTEASFDSGGEQNFAVSEGLTSTIKAITYGTNVRVLPRFDPATDELEIKITADVSDLTAPGGGTDIPGRTTSKLETLVGMKLGESLILSGIRMQSQQRNNTGLPLLSQIPIVGMLFGSQSGARQDTEGAVFIVPSVVESLPRDSMRLIEQAASQYDEFSGNMDDANSYPKKPPMSGSGTQRNK